MSKQTPPVQLAQSDQQKVILLVAKHERHSRAGPQGAYFSSIGCWGGSFHPGAFVRISNGRAMWQSIKIETKWIVLLAAIFASAGVISADKAYISTDGSGQAVASDQPPATGTAEEVMDLPEMPQTDAEKAQTEVQRINQKADQMAAERKQKENEREVATEQKERQEVSCAASRSRLQQLESVPPNRRLVADPDGTTHRVSAEEMQDLVAAAKRQVVEDCGSLDAPGADTTMDSGASPGSGERSKR